MCPSCFPAELPGCVLLSVAMCPKPSSTGTARVERAPPPAAFDFVFEFDVAFEFDSDLSQPPVIPTEAGAPATTEKPVLNHGGTYPELWGAPFLASFARNGHPRVFHSAIYFSITVGDVGHLPLDESRRRHPDRSRFSGGGRDLARIVTAAHHPKLSITQFGHSIDPQLQADDSGTGAP
jgi:hypothetical protein